MICEHGSLKRKCEICERDEEIKRLRDHCDALRAYINKEEFIWEIFNEAMGQEDV